MVLMLQVVDWHFPWFDNTAAGVSVADNTTIFEICFLALQTGTSSINFTNNPTIIEVAGVNEIKCYHQTMA